MSGRLITEMAQIVEQERMAKALEPRPERRRGAGPVKRAVRRLAAALRRRPAGGTAADGGSMPTAVILTRGIRREAR